MAQQNLHAAINLRLELLNLPRVHDEESQSVADLVSPILARQREQARRLADRLSPVDLRIENFLISYLGLPEDSTILPRRTLVLDQPGLARGMSLPAHSDSFASPTLTSYRLHNGVLHNPASDKRTTAGVFHIAEGGLPIPDDKLAVPREVYANILRAAFQAPDDMTTGSNIQPRCGEPTVEPSGHVCVKSIMHVPSGRQGATIPPTSVGSSGSG